MTDDDRVWTEVEVAELLRCTPASVRRLARNGVIVRVVPPKPPRYLRSSVERLLSEAYYVPDGEPDGPASTQAAAPRRGDRGTADGPLARAAVGGGDPLPRRIGPKADDVVVRRVTR